MGLAVKKIKCPICISTKNNEFHFRIFDAADHNGFREQIIALHKISDPGDEEKRIRHPRVDADEHWISCESIKEMICTAPSPLLGSDKDTPVDHSPHSYSKILECISLHLGSEGLGRARFELGSMYRNGYFDETGIRQYDLALAVKWFRKAAEQGHVHAQHRLALIYRDGYHDKSGEFWRCPALAVKWFEKAAEQGHADAQYRLALIYRDGYHDKSGKFRKCLALAVKWFRKAANQDHADAQYRLALIYRDGYHDKCGKFRQCPALAVKWFERAAKQGHPDAQFNFGMECWLQHVGLTMDDKGMLVHKDGYIPAEWFCRAAEQSHSEAMHSLGMAYFPES